MKEKVDIELLFLIFVLEFMHLTKFDESFYILCVCPKWALGGWTSICKITESSWNESRHLTSPHVLAESAFFPTAVSRGYEHFHLNLKIASPWFIIINDCEKLCVQSRSYSATTRELCPFHSMQDSLHSFVIYKNSSDIFTWFQAPSVVKWT